MCFVQLIPRMITYYESLKSYCASFNSSPWRYYKYYKVYFDYICQDEVSCKRHNPVQLLIYQFQIKMIFTKAICLLVLMSNSFAPRPRAPPGSPRVGHLLHTLQLEEYMELMTEEEVDLPVLAQMTKEQLQRLGVRRMGQRMWLLAAARNAFSNEEEDDRGDSVDISQPETENDNENQDLPEANENAINQGATEDIIHSQQQPQLKSLKVKRSNFNWSQRRPPLGKSRTFSK